MAEVYVLIQTAAAVVTALAATGILGLAYRIYSVVQEHDRVLFGEENVDGWNGIVPVVKENRDELEEIRNT